MLSGVAPWLSDHCIPVPEALRLQADPASLRDLLRREIAQSNEVLILLDEGYFDSAWTRLEFDECVATGRPMTIALLGSASLPEHVRSALPGSCEVHSNLTEALDAICKANGVALAPFAGQRLSCLVSQTLGELSLHAPAWLEFDAAARRALSPWNDQCEWRYGLVDAPQLAAARDRDALFDDLEHELWRQVDRLSRVSDFRPMGYHKLLVPNLDATALAISLQCVRAPGFCRYAAVTDGRGRRVEFIWFINGSLQRFHAVVPDLDAMIASLSFGERAERPPASAVSRSAPAWDQPIVWAQCTTCRTHASPAALQKMECASCRGGRLQCLTVHCNDRRTMSFPELRMEADRETRQVSRQGVLSQKPYETGLLCDGCYASLFVPAATITQLSDRPDLSMAHVWSGRAGALMWWMLTALYGALFGSGVVHRFIFLGLGVILVLERFERAFFDKKSEGEPAPWSYTLVYWALVIPAFGFGGGAYFFGQSQVVAAPADFAIAASLILCAMLAYSAGQPLRYRSRHVVQTLFVTLVFVGALIWRLATTSVQLGMTYWGALACGAFVLLIGLLLAHWKRAIGNFDAASLWASQGSAS
jgi:hypothetical protein